MNRIAIAISLPIGAALLLQANPSQAFTVVNVGGTDYDIEFYQGDLASFQTSGLSLPWFNNFVDAEAFANAFAAVDPTIYNSLSGPSGDANLGPLFYLSSGPDILVAWNDGSGAPWYNSTPFTGGYQCDGGEYNCSAPSLLWAYATLTPDTRVPAPLPLLGATAAFSFSRKLRRRLSAQKFTF